MDNKNSENMDIQKIGQNKKIMKDLDKQEFILISAKVIKINHVNKKQQRVLAITNKHALNIASPSSLMPNRIKRKIQLNKILGVSTSKFGAQMVIHVNAEEDYRFYTVNLKPKFIEAIVIAIGRTLHRPVKIYFYEDLTLQDYTTTKDDMSSKRRKINKCQPFLMDQQGLKNSNQKPQSSLIFKGNETTNNANHFQQFQIIKVLGRGAFGKVMLCKHKNTGIYYAVKSMRKQNIIESQTIQKTKTQRYILQKANHPFLVNIQYAFQTRQKIFLVMKFFMGGQLYSKIRIEKKFTEKKAKFYAAQVFLAIEHLHNMGFVYRDLKPQNILIDVNGYIKVSDYGLAKKLKATQKTYTIIGTPSYLCPQVIMNEGHSYQVDWWALGTLVYQMIFGNTPFYCKQQKEMFKLIINKQLQFPLHIEASKQCKHFLKSILNKYPTRRLGHTSSDQIKNHPWFKDVEWQKLYNMEIVPDYIPQINSPEDVSNFLQIFTKEVPQNSIVRPDYYTLNKHQKQFEDFEYSRNSLQQKIDKFHLNPQFSRDSSNLYQPIKQQSLTTSPTSFKKK